MPRYDEAMTMLKRPGASLFLVGVLLFFLVRPIVGKVWLIGGIVGPIAFIVGLIAIIGGIYLMFRGIFGRSR
jgi:hypothetical protein